MSPLQALINKASTSGFNKWLLNRALTLSVPFNAPHHFRILEIGQGAAKILLPHRRSNLNHVKVAAQVLNNLGWVRLQSRRRFRSNG